jgi:sugar (pentulose or hexulose) kinase
MAALFQSLIMTNLKPRGIAVVDVGYTNTKVILLDDHLQVLAKHEMQSPHHQGQHYGEIDVEPMLAFFAKALPALDQIMPIDTVVTSAHGACIAALDDHGALVMPLMDYMSEPPAEIVAAYKTVMPSLTESYSPLLPHALLHALQLFWQQRIDPSAFARTKTLLPLMQYVAMRLGGRAVTEISSMSCQTHLQDLNTHQPSSLAQQMGWDRCFAPRAKAWDSIGSLGPLFCGSGFRGRGDVLAGVHDSNANLLRYFSAGLDHFTLLSSGTWIIGFDTDADVRTLDASKDIVANVSVFGKTVASCRFFGGKEFEIVSAGAKQVGNMADVAALVARGVVALPSFTDSGGPMPGTAGRIVGTLQNDGERHALASIYCAQMTAQSLDAITSRGDIVVDGPFSQNEVYLQVLAALRPGQMVKASLLRDGTVAGAACLALMDGDTPPHIAIEMKHIPAPALADWDGYHFNWLDQAR